MFEKAILVGPSFESTKVAQLVQLASQFKSHISLVVEEKTANAKSIMGIISLDLKSGNVVKVVAHGEDEKQALGELEHIIAS